MKRFFLCIALAFAGLFASAQDIDKIPARMRVEITEVTNDDETYTLFMYKDQDGTFGYYFGLGPADRIVETFIAFEQVTETILFLGKTSDEAMESLEKLLAMYNEPYDTEIEYPIRFSVAGIIDASFYTAQCIVTKRLIGGKRLSFFYNNGQYTTETYLQKATVKSMIWSFKLHRKLHPNG